MKRISKIDLIEMTLVAAVVGPLAFWYFDSTPPQVRLHGVITSEKDPLRPPRIGENFVVHWTSTPHIRNCDGEVQVEIIQGPRIWPVLAKRKAMNPQLDDTKFQPAPWPLPGDIRPGPATYRVSTFWDCNWLQRLLPGFSLHQIGPDIQFQVLPEKSTGRQGTAGDGGAK